MFHIFTGMRNVNQTADNCITNPIGTLLYCKKICFPGDVVHEIDKILARPFKISPLMSRYALK